MARQQYLRNDFNVNRDLLKLINTAIARFGQGATFKQPGSVRMRVLPVNHIRNFFVNETLQD
jgi:hypothetical protein